MPATLAKNGDVLQIDLSDCRGSEFQDALARIKEIPGRRFDGVAKLWLVPAEARLAERIVRTMSPEAEEYIFEWIHEARIGEEAHLTTPLPDDAELLVPWATERCEWQPEEVNDEPFNGLFAWQRSAVDHMAKHGRAVLADDMGLGKTLQALSAVTEWRLRNGNPNGPKLVICPNSVKGSWAREIRRWLPPDDQELVIVSGATPAKRLDQIAEGIKRNAWVIVNWEQLRVKRVERKRRNGAVTKEWVMKEPLFEDTEWLCVIADEVHRAKSPTAQQTRGLWRIQKGKVMFGLSGTPMMNAPTELWSVLRWLWPSEYFTQSHITARPAAVSFHAFKDMYEDGYEEPRSGKWIVTGVKNPEALRFALVDKFVRRTSALLGLKGRKRIKYDLALNPKQQKLYDAAVTEMWVEVIAAMEQGDDAAKNFFEAAQAGANAGTLYRIPNGAARMLRLQQIIETPAILGGEDDSALMDDCVEKIEDSRPEQWVVGCKFKPSCGMLAERLEGKGLNVGLYTGDVSPAQRTEIEDAFQRGEIDVIVGTTKALELGVTLTRGRLVYHMTRDFVPDYNDQFESRLDRMGQQNEVLVYIPLATDTVASGKVEVINARKDKLVRSVLPKENIKEVRE